MLRDGKTKKGRKYSKRSKTKQKMLRARAPFLWQRSSQSQQLRFPSLPALKYNRRHTICMFCTTQFRIKNSRFSKLPIAGRSNWYLRVCERWSVSRVPIYAAARCLYLGREAASSLFAGRREFFVFVFDSTNSTGSPCQTVERWLPKGDVGEFNETNKRSRYRHA